MPNIDINISQIKVEDDPFSILIVPNIVCGLGIVMYDPTTKIGGGLHAVLPNCRSDSDPNPGKYVDKAISLLIEELESKGVERKNIVVKLAGGAKMLNTAGIPIAETNLKTAKETLMKEKLSVKGLDIGGSVKRKLSLNLSNGEVTVERLSEDIKRI